MVRDEPLHRPDLVGLVDHHHLLEHVVLPRARQAAHRAAFLLPVIR
jgi:hypothetical protein